MKGIQLFLALMTTTSVFGYSIKITDKGQRLVHVDQMVALAFSSSYHEARSLAEMDCPIRSAQLRKDIVGKDLADSIGVKSEYMIEYGREDQTGQFEDEVIGFTCLSYLQAGESKQLVKYKEVFRKRDGDKLDDCDTKKQQLKIDALSFGIDQLKTKRRCVLKYYQLQQK